MAYLNLELTRKEFSALMRGEKVTRQILTENLGILESEDSLDIELSWPDENVQDRIDYVERFL